MMRPFLDLNNRQREKEKAQVATDVCFDIKKKKKKKVEIIGLPSKNHAELTWKVFYATHTTCFGKLRCTGIWLDHKEMLEETVGCLGIKKKKKKKS